MRFWNWLTRTRRDHGWPGYLINGRIRTSTVALILAFVVISWVHNTYQPAPRAATVPETAQLVPPGFMPDPEYTWVPRTNVRTQPRTTSTSPTTTTTEPSPTETTIPTETTSETTTTGPAPTTLVDPDGLGPLPPTTVTPSSQPALPVPNRSGTSTTTTVSPGAGPVPVTSQVPPPPG